MNRRTQLSRVGRFHFDPLLIVVSTGLLLFGFVMVASSSLHLGVKMTGNSLYYPIRQSLHIALGLFLGVCVALTPLRSWEKAGQWLFLGGLLLLVIVLIPGLGVKVNGSTR